MNVNEMVEARCEVPEGESPHWSVNGHMLYPHQYDDIFIYNVTDNVSIIKMPDSGLDRFGTVDGSAELTLECTSFNSYTFTIRNESEQRRIMRFGKQLHTCHSL